MTREEAIYELERMKTWSSDLSDDEIEAIVIALKALSSSQEPREDVSDINDGNIYECPCGYGWDKDKVVRHHFCPNCGRKVLKAESEVD